MVESKAAVGFKNTGTYAKAARHAAGIAKHMESSDRIGGLIRKRHRFHIHRDDFFGRQQQVDADHVIRAEPKRPRQQKFLNTGTVDDH